MSPGRCKARSCAGLVPQVLPLMLLLCLATAGASASPADPLESPQWARVHQTLLQGADVVFDPKVEVMAPAVAEDAMNVPVSVRWTGLGQVQQVFVFADLNPIQSILRVHPRGDSGFVGLRFKVEQSTPVRAAVLTGDGRWHLGGRWLRAGGGGCTAPSSARADDAWERDLGKVHARRFPLEGRSAERLRFRVMHPMDTGLAPGIPAFFVEQLSILRGEDELLRLEPYEPISANPLFSLDLDGVDGGRLRLRGRDNNGNRIDAVIAP
jgi:sulfur-oxidizing protein SoxY